MTFKHFKTNQFLLFLLVGISAGLVHWASRFFLNMYTSFQASLIISYFIAMSFAFFLNKKYVFPNSPRKISQQMAGFFLTNLLMLPVVFFASIGILFVLNKIIILTYSREIAHAIAISFPTLVTFIVYKLLIFRKTN